VQQYLTQLDERGFIRVTGEDRVSFLDSLLTRKIPEQSKSLSKDQESWLAACLLTPQGKLLDEFLIFIEAEALLIDCDLSRRDEIIKRLLMYKLRAHVEIEAVNGHPYILWSQDQSPVSDEKNKLDPRNPRLGARFTSPPPPAVEALTKPASDWHTWRIHLAIPEGPIEMPPGSIFPLDYGLHLTNSISFDKGCFIGQEVTSRSFRRGTLKKSIFAVYVSDPRNALYKSHTLPADITSDIGTRGTLIAVNQNAEGFALLKNDVSNLETLSAGPLKLKLKTIT
jgi:tRNA-modifying protein YgfZ